jgi:Tol biopolymer transport system component
MKPTSVLLTLLLLAALLLGSCDTHLPEPAADGFLAEPGSILFVSNESGTSQLYSMQPDGSDVRQLTDDPDFPIGDAVWSPDETKIVLTGPQEALHYGPALYVVNADGTGRYRLTRTETPGIHLANGMRPVWSPDGRRIAFWRVMVPEALGLYETYVVDVDGTNEQRVTNSPRDAPSFHTQVSDWTPGDRLLGSVFDYAYRDSSGRHAENRKLVALDLDGSYQWIWGEEGDIVSVPILSPDGSQIAFKVRYKQEIDLGNGVVGQNIQEEIHVMDADGSNRRQLTHSEHKYVSPIAWSPDGTRVLVQVWAVSWEEDRERILILPLDGGTPVDITPFPHAKYCCNATSWRRTAMP